MIVILDDSPERTTPMAEALEDQGLASTVFIAAGDMLSWLSTTQARATRLLSLDHDLGPTFRRGEDRIDPGTGRDVVRWLCRQEPFCPVVVHTSNPDGGIGMMTDLEVAGWTAKRVWPIGADWIPAVWLPAVLLLLGRSGPGEESDD